MWRPRNLADTLGSDVGDAALHLELLSHLTATLLAPKLVAVLINRQLRGRHPDNEKIVKY
jgi:hypothetical protein